MRDGLTMGRRAFLAASGSLGLLAFLPEGARATGAKGHFFTAGEMSTLRAVTATLVPGPPTDPDPGALEAHCAEAIDLLLAAFSFDPPRIHAGGPFSGRAPSGTSGRGDDFAHFVPLDPYAELGWRIRIEGSQGKKEREFAGPVVGLQQTYREGLAELNKRAGGSFATIPALEQIVLLADPLDSDIQSFAGTVLANTLEAMYGPPEYGGNHDRVGWTSLGWPGDVSPRGYTASQVVNPDPGTLLTQPEAARARAAVEKFLPILGGIGIRGRR